MKRRYMIPEERKRVQIELKGNEIDKLNKLLEFYGKSKNEYFRDLMLLDYQRFNVHIKE